VCALAEAGVHHGPLLAASAEPLLGPLGEQPGPALGSLAAAYARGGVRHEMLADGMATRALQLARE
jgi:hypothetical protein